jgi:hypothetical protein
MMVSVTSTLGGLAMSWLIIGFETKSFLKKIVRAQYVIDGVGDDLSRLVGEIRSDCRAGRSEKAYRQTRDAWKTVKVPIAVSPESNQCAPNPTFRP